MDAANMKIARVLADLLLKFGSLTSWKNEASIV